MYYVYLAVSVCSCCLFLLIERKSTQLTNIRAHADVGWCCLLLYNATKYPLHAVATKAIMEEIADAGLADPTDNEGQQGGVPSARRKGQSVSFMNGAL
jgi:hypothetical protein